MKMIKLVLLSDVVDLGKKGEVVEVKPGYGRNYLLPKKMAKIATDSQIEKIAQKQKQDQAKRDAQLEQKRKIGEKLSGMTFEFERKTSAKGKLFGSITATTIAKEVSKKSNIDLSSKDIKLEKPIREAGEHKVTIKLAEDITVNIKIVIKGREIAKKGSK